MRRWIVLLGTLAFGTAFAMNDYSDVSRLPNDALKAMKIRPENVRPLKAAFEEPSGFRVGGTNATGLISRLPSLAGIAITELENAMRPGVLSGEGFLGRDESLLDVLARDNDAILAAGTTHRDLGFHLRVLGELGITPDRDEFLYRGERFSVSRSDTHGLQESPFADGTRDGRNATLTNLRTGLSVAYALLVPKMIERYGFYEGRKTSYRVDPLLAVAVLGAALGPDVTVAP